jgi:hypothetical protein
MSKQPNHRAEAFSWVASAEGQYLTGRRVNRAEVVACAAVAQVYATLALADAISDQQTGEHVSRSRKTAKQAGTAMETMVVRYLAERLNDDRIERRRQSGAKDRGDVTGVRTPLGERVVIEIKDYGGQLKPGPWLNEVAVEAGNDDAPVGVVVAKRRGTTDPAAQFVLMDLGTLAVLLGAPVHPFRPEVINEMKETREL